MISDTVMIDAMKWHRICYELGFSERGAEFQKYFNCTVKWKSRLDEWLGEDVSEKPNPVMLLTFADPKDASMFTLKFL